MLLLALHHLENEQKLFFFKKKSLIDVPNSVVDPNGVDVNVLGCVAVELNRKPLALLVWLIGVDWAKKLVLPGVAEPKLYMTFFLSSNQKRNL